MNLYLIGYRCTGKSSVGRTLADRLARPFIDTDQAVVQAAGASIARIVAEQGWPRFRELERRALTAAADGGDRVVATGGGIVADERNVTVMKRSGQVVWLTAEVRTIERRLAADAGTADGRPSLTGRDAAEEIRAVLAERMPLYAAAADLTIATDRATIAGLCRQILAALGWRKMET